MSNLFGLFLLYKTLLKVIFFTKLFNWIRIYSKSAAGSGSPSRKTAAYGSAKNECRSTSLPAILYTSIDSHTKRLINKLSFTKSPIRQNVPSINVPISAIYKHLLQ